MFLLTILVAGMGSMPAYADLEGAGALLPLQNRTGDSELGVHVERILRAELSLAGYALVEPRPLRDALRRHRLRYADLVAPAELAEVAEDLGVAWFISSTLHAVEIDDVPRITVSARLYIAGRPTIAWAGFESRDGLDSRGVLGVDVVEEFEVLIGDVLRRLVADMTYAGRSDHKIGGRWGPDRAGFRREPISLERLGTVAVIPFDSVADDDPSGSAETVTSVILAVLYRRGVPVVVPGSVSAVLRLQGHLWRGAADHATLAAVSEATAADTILTGTVESYSNRGGLRGGGPRVTVSGKLLDVHTGQILWINGQNRESVGGPFGTGRVRDPGKLAEEIVESLVAGFLNPGGRRNAEVTP
jgi:TolB-like protein